MARSYDFTGKLMVRGLLFRCLLFYYGLIFQCFVQAVKDGDLFLKVVEVV